MTSKESGMVVQATDLYKVYLHCQELLKDIEVSCRQPNVIHPLYIFSEVTQTINQLKTMRSQSVINGKQRGQQQSSVEIMGSKFIYFQLRPSLEATLACFLNRYLPDVFFQFELKYCIYLLCLNFNKVKVSK